MWVYEEEGECMVQREITFVPGLYKIFDEILGKLLVVTFEYLMFLFIMRHLYFACYTWGDCVIDDMKLLGLHAA